MTIYLFFFKNITIGGAELLIEKLSQQLINDGNQVVVFYDTIMCEMEERYKKNGMELYSTKDWIRYSDVKAHIKKMRKIYCITFEWDIFFDVYNIRTLYEKKTLLYAIDYSILAFGNHRKESLFKNVEKKIMKKCLIEMIEDHYVLSMDEQTVGFTAKYFDFPFSIEKKMNIVRIPINMDDINTNLNIGNKSTNVFKILSIARAEFPFKAYLLGLVDFMCKTDENVFLDVIAYGPDINILKDKIEAQPDSVKKRILLHGKKDNSQLDRFYREANLYIGMGTTILEASVRNTIAIPVVARTEMLIARNFFHNDYRYVAIDDDGINLVNELITEARNMSIETYNKVSNIGKKLVLDYYSSYSVAKQITIFLDKKENDSKNYVIKNTRIFRRVIRKIRKNIRKEQNEKPR